MAEESNNKPDDKAAQEKDESVQGPTVFIVGLGQTGRELLYRLMRHLPVVGIDVEARKLEATAKHAGDEVKLYQKDATSRLAWSEMGIQEDDVVVTATRRDEVNLEAHRVAREGFGVKRMLGLIHGSDRIKDYEALGVETVNRARVLAAFMESRVLRDRRTALNVGLGQGEIMEVPILPGSPVAGRPLSTFHARPWLVGAIYRKERLIVPHGHTVIQEDDRVVLIGEPHILSGIADFFKMGEPEFPLQYGPRIGVLAMRESDEVYEKVVSESNYLAANTKATTMVMLSIPGVHEPDVDAAERVCGGTGLSCEPEFFPDEADKPWPRLLQTQDFGCLVLGLDRLGLMRRLGLRDSMLMRVLEEAEFPVLVSRGSHPYKSILVPVAGDSNPLAVSELAINLARLFKARLEAVTVTEPAFAAGAEAVDEQKRVLDRVAELTSLYRLAINVKHREGNPIKEIADAASEQSLMVMGHRKGGRRMLPTLNLLLEVLDRVKCSVMILPYGEDEG